MDDSGKQDSGKSPGRSPGTLIGAIVVALALAGGGGWFAWQSLQHKPLSIAEVTSDIREYDGKTVTVKGSVARSVNILGFKSYEISDGSGTIRVITERGLPSEGSEVEVTGVVNQAFKLGPAEVIVIMEPAEGGGE